MKAEDIRMMGNRILLLPVEEETASGFIIPEQYRSFRTCIVKAVGNGARLKNGDRRPIPLQVGDAIVLSDDYRMPVDVDGKEHFIVSDEKVLCVPGETMNGAEFELVKKMALELGKITEQLIRLQELMQESVDLIRELNIKT